MNASSELSGYFEHINGLRFYPATPPPKPAPSKFSLENTDLMPVEIQAEIVRLTQLLSMVQARENAKCGIKTRDQKRAEEVAAFINTFDERHLAVLESIARKIDPPKKMQRITSVIEFWSLAGTRGSKAVDYRISLRGEYVLELLRERYPNAKIAPLTLEKPAKKSVQSARPKTKKSRVAKAA